MSQQMSLFPTPLSRNTDPVTSYEAAETLHRSGRWKNQKQAVLEVLRQLGNATSAEIAERMGGNRYIPARRLPELRREGLVEQGPARVCRVLKSRCITWNVKEI